MKKKNVMVGGVLGFGIAIIIGIFVYNLGKPVELEAVNEVAIGRKKIVLEPGDSVTQNYWNEDTETIYTKDGKEQVFEDKLRLFGDIEVGTDYKKVTEFYKIAPGYARIDLEKASEESSDSTDILDFEYENDRFWEKYNVLDADMTFVLQKKSQNYILLSNKEAEDIEKKDGEFIRIRIDFIGEVFSSGEEMREKKIGSNQVIRIEMECLKN